MRALVNWGWWAVAVTSGQALHFTPAGAIPGPADLIRVQGDRAYIVADKMLAIFDVSNSAAPHRTGVYISPEKIWGIRPAGSLVYLAADLSGLVILDVSNPAEPKARGALKTRGQAKAVVVYKGKAVVADHMSGLDILDVSDPAKPVAMGSVFMDGYSRDVALAGSFVYAVDSPTGFYVLDLTKPEDFAGSLQSANGQVVVAPEGADSPKIACVPGRAGLQIFDVSNPAAPSLAATFRTPGTPIRAVVHGNLAYIADGREGLQVADLSTPAKPVAVGSFKTVGPARDVAVAGPLVFVVTGTGENAHVEILRTIP
jgi:hypothetical protein